MSTMYIVYYKCPHCSQCISTLKVGSGNTFGAYLFSDGFLDAPGLPENIQITKCLSCNTFFWLKDENCLGELSRTNKFLNSTSGIMNLEHHLSLAQYRTALEKKVFRSKEEEKYLRIRLWWKYNDRVRYKSWTPDLKAELLKFKRDEKDWRDNAKRLVELLDHKISEEKLMKMELLRHLGDFVNCFLLALGDIDEDFSWIRFAILAYCLDKKTLVFHLDEENGMWREQSDEDDSQGIKEPDFPDRYTYTLEDPSSINKSLLNINPI